MNTITKDQIEALNWDECNKLISLIEERRKTTYEVYREEKNEEYERRRIADEKLSIEKERLSKFYKIVYKKYIKEGVFIKLNGCRDNGYRLVHSVNFDDGYVTGYQLDREGYAKDVLTTNGLDKISKIKIDGEFVGIKELVNNECKNN